MSYSDIENAKQNYKDIEKQYFNAKTAYNQAHINLIKLRQEHIKCLVGLCFEDKESYFIISKIPELKFGKDGECFTNLYQLPAIIINKTLSLPYEDTIFITAVDSENPVENMSKKFKSITMQEFKTIYDKRVKDILATYIEDSENE